MKSAIEQLIDDVPDFPEKGILFRDISPLLANDFPATIKRMLDLFSEEELSDIQAFAGIDARGFIFASAMAAMSGKNMIMLRKHGKLPKPSLSKSYDLEYGSAQLELRPQKSSRVIIVDDVLATGGTFKAAADLCLDAGHDIKGFAALIDIAFLNNFSWNGLKVRSLVQYHE